MNRKEKAKFVQDFAHSYQKSDATFVVNVAGLSVNQVQSLRSKLRQSGARLQIGKVRLMKIAIRNAAGDDTFVDSLGSQVGAVFAGTDVQQTAQSLVDFAKQVEIISLVSGVFKNRFISVDGIKSLASIPPYPVLIAQLAGSLNAPIVGLARSLKEVQTKLARCLNAVLEKKS